MKASHSYIWRKIAPSWINSNYVCGRASLVAQLVKNSPAMWEASVPGTPRVGKISWRRAWQCTPVFFPRETHRQKSLAGYSLPGCKESDTPERLNTAQHSMSVEAVNMLKDQKGGQCWQSRVSKDTGKRSGQRHIGRKALYSTVGHYK